MHSFGLLSKNTTLTSFVPFALCRHPPILLSPTYHTALMAPSATDTTTTTTAAGDTGGAPLYHLTSYKLESQIDPIKFGLNSDQWQFVGQPIRFTPPATASGKTVVLFSATGAFGISDTTRSGRSGLVVMKVGVCHQVEQVDPLGLSPDLNPTVVTVSTVEPYPYRQVVAVNRQVVIPTPDNLLPLKVGLCVKPVLTTDQQLYLDNNGLLGGYMLVARDGYA